jgi:hypothetical protein
MGFFNFEYVDAIDFLDAERGSIDTAHEHHYVHITAFHRGRCLK